MTVVRTHIDLECFSLDFLEKAEAVFLRPTNRLKWDDIVPRAVAQNTFRGFHRIDNTISGAKESFVGYFRQHRGKLIDTLMRLENRDELHALCNDICQELRRELTNCKTILLRPYNKIRKLVDLYIEHLAAISNELESCRERLTPLLFLPLDSWIMAHPGLFADAELSLHGLTRKSTYSAIDTERSYAALQVLITQKADTVSNSLGRPFYSIYFDLLWQCRFLRQGGNLFETNG